MQRKSSINFSIDLFVTCCYEPLSEIQKIDFSKIDFGEMYQDLQNRAQLDFKMSKEDIESKLKGYQSNTGEASTTLKEKMQRFYGK